MGRGEHKNVPESCIEKRNFLSLARLEPLLLYLAVFTHFLYQLLYFGSNIDTGSINYVKSMRMRYENIGRHSGIHLSTTITITHVFVWKMKGLYDAGRRNQYTYCGARGLI
jgi:hypothetical protein